MIGWLICKFKGHAYRQARKAEDQSTKTCKRCGDVAPVIKRKPKEEA